MLRKYLLTMGVLLLVASCGSSGAGDWRAARVAGASPEGRQLYLVLPGTSDRTYRLDLEQGTLEQVATVPRLQDASPLYSFRMDRDTLVITPQGTEPVRHYINDLPARVTRTSGLPVSRYHGKRGHFMQILGTFPGGVLVREPKRLHLGGGFADAYFPVSPEGTVGAEVYLPTADGTGNHKVFFLSRRGVIVAAVEHGRALRGIDARTGETRFTVR